MTTSSEYDRSLVDIVALALEPYDIPTGRSWTAAERVEPAEKVLAALGLEPWFYDYTFGLHQHPAERDESFACRIHDGCEALYKVTTSGGDAAPPSTPEGDHP